MTKAVINSYELAELQRTILTAILETEDLMYDEYDYDNPPGWLLARHNHLLSLKEKINNPDLKMIEINDYEA